jgi:glutathione S-transferase
MVLAESAFIAQYLSEHFTSHKKLLPDRWKPGQEGKVGGETEEWMRCQYLLYYVEGSFMMRLVLNLVLSGMFTGPCLATDQRY